MRTSAAVAGIAASAVAAGALYAAVLRSQRRAGPSAEADGEHDFGGDDVICAICLERPRLPCLTDCGHRFCTPCFIAWWRTQPGTAETAHTKLARCPMCTNEVSRLRMLCAEDAATTPEARAAMASVRTYNRDVDTMRVFKPIRRVLGQARNFCNAAALTLYGASGIVWGVVHDELASAGGMFQIATPRDERMRLVCSWACVTHFCGVYAGGAPGLPRSLTSWVADVQVKRAPQTTPPRTDLYHPPRSISKANISYTS